MPTPRPRTVPDAGEVLTNVTLTVPAVGAVNVRVTVPLRAIATVNVSVTGLGGLVGSTVTGVVVSLLHDRLNTKATQSRTRAGHFMRVRER